MKQTKAYILTVEGGSSSIKFALFDTDPILQRVLTGTIDRIGLIGASLAVKGLDKADKFIRSVTAANHAEAVGLQIDWVEKRFQRGELILSDIARYMAAPSTVNHSESQRKWLSSCTNWSHSIPSICRKRFS